MLKLFCAMPCCQNRFHADLEGFNVRSSAFKIDGVEGDIYLTDFPNDDQLTGIIKFFTITDGIITYIIFNNYFNLCFFKFLTFFISGSNKWRFDNI